MVNYPACSHDYAKREGLFDVPPPLGIQYGKEIYYNSWLKTVWTIYAWNKGEWNNLALEQEHSKTLLKYRAQLTSIIPDSIPEKPKSAEQWKSEYFNKNPKADVNKNGELSWQELNAHKKLMAAPKDAEYWKNFYFKKNPEADSNEDGTLSWPEFHAHKKKAKVSPKKK